MKMPGIIILGLVLIAIGIALLIGAAVMWNRPAPKKPPTKEQMDSESEGFGALLLGGVGFIGLGLVLMIMPSITLS